MATAVKILKTILILALIAAVILVFWFGIMSGKVDAEAPIPVPTGLGLYPTDLVDTPGWKAEFDLEAFIEQEIEFDWDESTGFYGSFKFDSDNPGKEVYDGDIADINIDAINLIRLADYNEKNLPFYGYFTDAGGAADIAGSIKGNLMSQTIHMKDGDSAFHQNINAIVQDPDFPMSAATVTAAEAILNKANRQLDYGGYTYYLKGASPQYLFGDDLFDETGEIVQIDGKPTEFDDGRCSANWKLAAVEKKEIETKELPSGLTAVQKFKLTYGNKYIMSLNPTDYERNAPSTWFDTSKTVIEKIYVDDEGNPANEETDHWYIRVVLVADLPERPADGNGIEAWAKKCNDCTINKALSILNPVYSEATKDFTRQYLNNLQNYTGANPVWFTALKYTYEIWDCGVMRSWRTDEGWYGTLALFTGDVQPFNPTTYTYSQEYCNVDNFLDYLRITK